MSEKFEPSVPDFLISQKQSDRFRGAVGIVLALATGLGRDATHWWARFADVSDDILFCAIALFAGVLAVLLRARWLRAVAVLVAVLSAVRGIGGPLGLTALDVAAPLSFLVLMLALGVYLMARDRPLVLAAESAAI